MRTKYKYTYMMCSKNIYIISQDKKYICIKVQTSLIKSIQLINPMFNQRTSIINKSVKIIHKKYIVGLFQPA